MTEPDFLIFASDATITALWGGALLLVAVIALFADWHRGRRKHIDRVGWIPWTPLFLACAVCGVALLTVALKGWAAGG